MIRGNNSVKHFGKNGKFRRMDLGMKHPGVQLKQTENKC